MSVFMDLFIGQRYLLLIYVIRLFIDTVVILILAVHADDNHNTRRNKVFLFYNLLHFLHSVGDIREIFQGKPLGAGILFNTSCA